MATWENEFTTPGSSARIWLVAEVTYGAYDIALNRTPINWYLRGEERVNASPFNLNGVSSGAMAADGSVFSSGGLNYDYRATNAINYIASGSKWVTHEADGTKTITITASFNGGDSVLGTASISATLTLPTIPRATTPVLSAYAVDAGVALTIDLSSRADPSFTHDISYAFEGGSSVSIATGVGTSQGFTPPITLLTQIPNALSGICVITVVTKNGGTTIGTKTVNLTVTVPATAIPDFTLTSVAESVAAMITMMGGSSGPYLKLNSKPIVTLDSPSGYQGSTIASTKVEIGTQPAITGGAWTTGTRTATLVDPITQYGGTVLVKVTATDTRGRKRERTTTIDVQDYTLPLSVGVIFKRSTSGGVDSILGTYLKIVHTSAVESVLVSAVEKNALKYRVDWKLKTDVSWTLGSVTTPGGVTYTTDIITAGFAANIGYDVRLALLDNTGTVALITGTLSTAQVAFNINPDGDGVGIGKVYEAGRGSLDILGQAYVNDGARIFNYDDVAEAADIVAATSDEMVLTPLYFKPYKYQGRRNLIRNARLSVNQRGAVSAASLADLALFLDSWRNASGTTTSTITWVGSDDTGRVITFASIAGVLRYIRQTIERRDVVPGDYIFGQYGTAQGRCYNAGASAPAWADLPIVVTLDGTDNVRVEFRNVPDAATATVDRPFLVRADEWSGYFPDISYAEDLAWCQRYYQRIQSFAGGATAFAAGWMANSTTFSAIIPLVVEMRATPTLSGTAAASLQVRTGSTLTVSAYSIGSSSSGRMVQMDATTSSGTTGDGGIFRSSATGHYIELSADI